MPIKHDLRHESTAGATIPGFGDTREGHRQVFTLGETHVFNPSVINEARAGSIEFTSLSFPII